MIVSVVMAVVDLRPLAGVSATIPRAAIWNPPVGKLSAASSAAIPSGYGFGLGQFGPPEAGVWQGWPREWLITTPKQQCTLNPGVAIEALGKRFQPKVSRSYTFCREYLALLVVTLRFQRVPFSLPEEAFDDFLKRLLNAQATFRVRSKTLQAPLDCSHANLASLQRAALPQKKSPTGVDKDLLMGVPPLVLVKDTGNVLTPTDHPQLTKAWKVGLSAKSIETESRKVPTFIIHAGSPLLTERDDKRREQLYQNMSRMQSYICGNWFEGVSLYEMISLVDRRKNLLRKEADRLRLVRFVARAATARRLIRKQLKSEDAKLVASQVESGAGIVLDSQFQLARNLVKARSGYREHTHELLEAMRA